MTGGTVRRDRGEIEVQYSLGTDGKLRNSREARGRGAGYITGTEGDLGYSKSGLVVQKKKRYRWGTEGYKQRTGVQ